MSELKKLEYRSPHRIRIDTGHKGFDAQADYLGTGNVCSNVQRSCYIRAHSERECNGYIHPRGHLQRFDLDEVDRNLPHLVKSLVEKWCAQSPAILYKIRHFNAGGERIHGYVLTDTEHYTLGVVHTALTTGTRKSFGIMEAVLPYISRGERTPVSVAPELYTVYISEEIVEVRKVEVAATSAEEARKLAYAAWVESGECSGEPQVNVNSRSYEVVKPDGSTVEFESDP